MAWNWEKGCEEETPYQFGGGIYTPPNWDKGLGKLVLAWEKAEAIAKRSKSKSYEREAIKCWEALEAEMTLDSAQSRRDYLEWRARGKKLDSTMGFKPVDEDSLPLLNRIVSVGYRTMAKTAHPDLGGSDEEFRSLKQAKVQLDTILKEVEGIL